MFTITDEAASHLRTLLSSADDPDFNCFRMTSTSDGAELAFDHERPGDVRIEKEGDVLLVMDEKTADLLDGLKLTYDESESRLVLD